MQKKLKRIPRKSEYLAQIISIIFHPIFIPTFLFYTIQKTTNHQLSTQFILFTLLFTVVLPALFVYFLKKANKIEDIELEKRKDRLIPYLVSTLILIFWVTLTFLLSYAPQKIIAIQAGMVISLSILLIINLKYKISVHAATLGNALGTSIMILSFNANTINFILTVLGAFIALLLVCYSRVLLKKHSIGQVLWGSIMGIVIGIIILV